MRVKMFAICVKWREMGAKHANGRAKPGKCVSSWEMRVKPEYACAGKCVKLGKCMLNREDTLGHCDWDTLGPGYTKPMIH